MNDFSEICEKEKAWMEQINSGLMNPIYCKYELEPFYLDKKKQLEIANSNLLNDMKSILNSIILEIENIFERYRATGSIDQNDYEKLSNLFLINQVNNVNKRKEDIEDIKNQILNNELNIRPVETEDYLYDDFPSKTSRIK